MKFITLFTLAAITQFKLVQADFPFCQSNYYSPDICKKFNLPPGVDCQNNGSDPYDVDMDRPAKFSSTRAYEFAAGITNTFENSQPQNDYATCMSIGDGRGYTCGSGGYTTDDGSMLDPLQRYAKLLKKSKNPFEKYMAKLEKISQSGCSHRGSTSGFQGLGSKWTYAACTDKLFRQAQDESTAAEIDYWAMRHAAYYNITTDLGLAVIRDTMVQHGDGGGEPHIGLERIGELTKQALQSNHTDEKTFITKFLEIRRQMLCCYRPADSQGKVDTTWPQSADRIADLQYLVGANNWAIKPPINLPNYEETIKEDFNLYATSKECKKGQAPPL